MTVVEECDTIARLARMKDHLLLSHVSWETYDGLLDQVQDRRLRHTYDQGSLEFMTRSSIHEIYKTLLGLFVVILAEEWKLPLFLGGELTLRRRDLERGLEPDQCFWIQREFQVRGKKEIDFSQDPPPDLFIEVEVSRSVLDRISILAALEIPEIWRFDGSSLEIGLLQKNGEYQWGKLSRSFPQLDSDEVVRFLSLAGSTDHLSILRAFRDFAKKTKS